MIDWTDAFENSAYIPRAAEYRTAWPGLSQAFRDSHANADCDIAYGDGPRQRYDLFRADAPRGTVIFVHGGYWHQTDKSLWSFLAAGPLAHGWSVALAGYTLAPQARIRDITAEVARAVSAIAATQSGPIRLAGHSAGGHLVSRMACPDTLDPVTRGRVEHIVSISGVHHLVPLQAAAMNQTLGLDPAEAEAESPALSAPAPGTRICFWVGAAERPEFLRQTRMIGETWSRAGAQVSETYDPGHDHFSVVNTLADPDSALVSELLSKKQS